MHVLVCSAKTNIPNIRYIRLLAFRTNIRLRVQARTQTIYSLGTRLVTCPEQVCYTTLSCWHLLLAKVSDFLS